MSAKAVLLGALVVVAAGAILMLNQPAASDPQESRPAENRDLVISETTETPPTGIDPAENDSPRLRGDEPPTRKGAFAAALLEKSPDVRLGHFLTLLETLTSEDAPAIFAMLEKLDKDGKDVGYAREAFARRWGAIDPQAAIAFFDAQPGDAAKWLYDELFTGWAAKDPQGARDWLNANSEHARHSQAMVGYFGGYARKDSKAATRTLLDSLPTNDPMFTDAMFAIAAAAREDSTNTLKKWFDAFPSEGAALEAKKIAAYATYKNLPPERYAANADWVAKQAEKPWRTDRLIAEFARHYGSNFPKNAMNWVQNTAPRPGPQPAAGIIVGVGEIVRAWERRSLKDLQMWLEDNRSSPVFNQAARDLAIELAGRNQALAEYWGSQVTAEWAKPQVEHALARHRK